jgi:hypothetical protein
MFGESTGPVNNVSSDAPLCGRQQRGCFTARLRNLMMLPDNTISDNTASANHLIY